MNLKAMIEKRNALMDEMDGLFAACKTGEEERAFSEEEAARFEELENEIRALDKTIEAAQAREKMERREAPAGESPAEIEARAFADYIMGRSLELRTGEQNMSMGNNGAIIPTTIAGRIIKAVRDRCPILAGATRYNVKGTLKVPVWGKANSTHDITVGYQSEFTEITADSGAFTSVDLGGYLAGALTLIGRSVENNGAFNVTDFIINQMAEEIAIWMEGHEMHAIG